MEVRNPLGRKIKVISNVKATMFVFAGNNGGGKSTIKNLIIDQIGVV